MGRSQAVPRGGTGEFGTRADDSGCSILHVDMDAFFASVEVRRQPALAGRPLVVGGLGPRGVVSSASYEARTYGVRSAMPMARARALCPHATFLPPDMSAYAEASRAVMRILRDVTPLVEPLSVDEAFLDVAGARRLFGSPARIAERIRRRMREEQRLTCSVGVGPTKFVAKLGSTRAKPDGVIVVPADRVLDFLHPLPVEALWGVGDRTAQHLRRLGIKTVGDVAASPVGMLRSAVGEAAAAHLHELALGHDPRPVTTRRIDKSIGAEVTFDADVADPETVHRALLSLSGKVGRRLRDGGQVARTVTIKIRFSDFRTLNRSRTLPAPTAVAKEIFDTAWALYEALRPGERIRLVGIRAEGLARAGTAARQPVLDENGPGWREAEEAADAAAARFGRSVIGPASLLRSRSSRRAENPTGASVLPLSDPPPPS